MKEAIKLFFYTNKSKEESRVSFVLIKKHFMIIEICVIGFVGRVFFLTLKMGLKRKKVENYCFKMKSNRLRCALYRAFFLMYD